MSMSLEYTQDRQAELKGNMESVLSEIESVSSSSKARLVPISKLKPASDVQALYDAGYRHFGENYIQELADKAEVVSYPPFEGISAYIQLPKDIEWHFVGNLQSNKSKIAACKSSLGSLGELTISDPKPLRPRNPLFHQSSRSPPKEPLSRTEIPLERLLTSQHLWRRRQIRSTSSRLILRFRRTPRPSSTRHQGMRGLEVVGYHDNRIMGCVA